MEQSDQEIYYKAYVSRDSRFDGLFYIGVVSTGIYCRPVCTAKTPKKSNFRFFKSAAAAEKELFRPCLRCRPELAPGSAPVDDASRIANSILLRIKDQLPEDGADLEEIASGFQLSARQIRRIVKRELGVSPIELITTRRLLLAKQLLTETALPVTEVAFASGFSSLRRFNDAFAKRYRISPTQLRKAGNRGLSPKPSESLRLQLGYRPPLDWRGMLQFLNTRLLKGVESVQEDAYCRTVGLGRHQGWVRVFPLLGKHALGVELPHSLVPILPLLLERLRNLFDLNARPDLIGATLLQNKLLENLVRQNPGLRVPGAWDGFELALRGVLGQQITVRAAATLAGRVAEALGEKIETPYPGLNYLSPTPERIASATIAELMALGISRARAQSIVKLAEEVASGRLKLEAGAPPEPAIRQLVSLPGIGPWTAHYIAMRALRWPDAFPKEDLGLRTKLGGVSAREAEKIAQAWRPWRSYALLYLWHKPIQR